MEQVELKAINLHWISEEIPESDLCAHGHVWLKIGDKIVSDEDSGDWTVSATAYKLLHTLQADYVPDGSCQLLPCCGHDMVLDNKKNTIIILGCPTGVNWKIIHRDGKVVHTFADEEMIEIDFGEWTTAVCAFSDQVMEFYQESEVKVPYKDSKAIYEKFIADWESIRAQALI